MKPRDLIAHARRLAKASPRRPIQADLRRAVSAAYYALFHAIAACAADTLIGTTAALRSSITWQRVFRSLEHGYAKSQCVAARGAGSPVPASLQTVADDFVALQSLRHDADYDPFATFNRLDVEAHITQAENAIAQLAAAPVAERRILSAWVIFKSRG